MEENKKRSKYSCFTETEESDEGSFIAKQHSNAVKRIKGIVSA